MSLLEDLQKVYEFHVENEWVRGANKIHLGDGVHGYCLYGSIIECLLLPEYSDDDWDRYSAVTRALRMNTPEVEGKIPELMAYNDLFASGKQDITDLIKKTIAMEAARVGSEIMGGAS